MENRQLYHYGVKGMKWGIRRNRRQMSDDAKTARSLKKKKVSELSNAELKKLNERTRLEQEHARLHPSAARKGWKFVAASAGVMGTALAVYNNSSQVISIGKKVGGKIIDAAGDRLMSDLMKNPLHVG